MKKTMIALLAMGAALVLAGTALAGDDPGGDGPRGGAMKKFRAIRLAELQEALNLDDKTMLKLNEVLKKSDEKRGKLHKEARESMRELKGLMDAQRPDEGKITATLDKLAAARGKLQEVHQDQMTEARKLLTPVQQAKFVLHMERFRKHMREMIKKSWGGHGQGHGGPMMGPPPGGPGMGLGMMGPGPDMPPPPPEDEEEDL